MTRFLLAFIIILSSTKIAFSETSTSPDLPLEEDPFVAQVMANPVFKLHFEGLLACTGIEIPEVKMKCFELEAVFAERLAKSQGWDIEKLKAAITQNDKSNSVQESETSPTKPETKWNVRTEISAIDDSTNVFLSIDSDEHIRARFGRSGPMRLFIQCRENTTLLYIYFNGHFMSDYSNGAVTYRLDTDKALGKRMQESNDNEALGLWSGAQSIPFIKAMFGHDKLLIRATPHSESALTATFSITGLEAEIEPLRKACNW